MFAIYSGMTDQWKNNLRHAIKAKQTTMNALSKQLGRNPHYITQLLNRSHAPSVKTLEPVAELLGISVSDLIEADEAELDAQPEMELMAGANNCDEDLFREAYKRAREIEHELLGGRGPRLEFAKMVSIIYDEMLTEKLPNR